VLLQGQLGDPNAHRIQCRLGDEARGGPVTGDRVICLEQAAWLFRARAQATEIVLRERVLLPPESADGDDPDEDEENDALPGSGERPVVIDRDHPQ